MLLKQLCKYISSQVGWLTWIIKLLGQTKERNSSLEYSAYDGFGDREKKEMSEDVEDDHANWAGAPGPAWAGGVGASNKYTFRKVSQIVYSQGFAGAECMYFCKLMSSSNTKVQQICLQVILRFSKLSQVWFRRLSQGFAQICKYGFTVFSQYMVSQTFARIRKESQMDFRNHSPRIRKSKIMVFRKDSQWALCWWLVRQGSRAHLRCDNWNLTPISRTVSWFSSAALHRILSRTCWFVPILYFLSETNEW